MIDILTQFDKSSNTIDYSLEKTEFLNISKHRDVWDISSISNIFGYIIVNKYLKILGNDENFGIKWANGIYEKYYDANSLLVAYDIFGGLFVIKDYHSGGEQIWYFAPDTMNWENLKITYHNFVKWICTDEFSLFYSDFPIEYVINNSIQIEEDGVLLIYPYLWSKEYKIATPTINVVPFRELFELNRDMYIQLN
ncbi:DUF2625 family protein [Streptococcus caprae]|uniref:DUF2625 family protein n=1 Tax=Streptococcus caprae TaxID=1640501 RepID=A0ABV8CU11_9STRE